MHKSPRISQWILEMRFLLSQWLRKWNQDIIESITIETRLHKQGLSYQEKKVKVGQNTPVRKWSISKRVTRAHVNVINFDLSKVVTKTPEPNTTKDENMAKWVQHLT